jgi:TonB family protein
LPWTPVADEDRRFRNISASVLILSLVLAVAVSVINVPKPDRLAVREVPPQLAKLILEKEKPKPPPPKVEEPKKEEKKKEEKKPEKKPEEKKPEPEPEKPKVDVEAARKKAAKSGLLAMADDLADLRDTSAPDLGKNLSAVTTSTAKAAPAAESQLLTLNSRGSGGVDTSSLARASRRPTGAELQARATEQVDSPVEAQAKLETKPGKGRDPRSLPRTLEEIQLVIQRYKGQLTLMHTRALRSDPNIRGNVVLELTIAPSGKVTHCKIVSSEFNAPEFLEKVIARVKTFEFGAKDVDEMTVTFPFEFIPTG